MFRIADCEAYILVVDFAATISDSPGLPSGMPPGVSRKMPLVDAPEISPEILQGIPPGILSGYHPAIYTDSRILTTFQQGFFLGFLLESFFLKTQSKIQGESKEDF